MTSILLIVQIAIVVFLVIAVLLQKSSSIGLGAYSGSNESVFGAKGPASFLAKMTFFLMFLFISNTVAMGYFYGQENQSSVTDSIIEDTTIAAPAVVETAIEDIQAPASIEANTSK
ncbi:preprotein translocase subunit SecG [Sulfurimonas sp. MAG313]|nr:preprotein translocase subunit SecG [Sulfurimonas sp. MAG313]MDF1881079.1 preprotein translocase subunit SecG [Sulfurimonas sp. MAG313]